MESKDANKMAAVMKVEESDFIDSAIQNPDNDIRGGIPDLVNGPSYQKSLMISTEIDGSGVVGTKYDVYVVQWDFETKNNEPCVGRYYTRNNAAGSNSSNFYDNTGPVLTIPVGGVCAYVMESGRSPFPSDNPSVLGPVAPVKTIKLQYKEEILQGNTRVVGSNFQLKYTAPEVTAQGLITQATYSSYAGRDNCYFTPGAASNVLASDQLFCITKSMIPGDVSTMVKYPGSVQRTAFEGALQAAIVNLHSAVPSLPDHDYRVYKSTVIPTGANNYFDLFVGQHRVGAGLAAGLSNPTVWDSHCEIHFAVITGLIATATMQLLRRITVETFPDSNDQNIAFAKPSPLANLQALTDVMNAMRSHQRFWANKDNDLGNFARAMRRGVKKVGQVAMIAAPVAAVGNPRAAAAMQLATDSKRAVSAVKHSTPDQNAAQIANLQRQLTTVRNQVTHTNEVGNMKVAKSKQPRTKPPKRK